MLEVMMMRKVGNPGVTYQGFLNLLVNNNVSEVVATSTPGSVNTYVKIKTVASRGTMWGSPFNTILTWDSRYDSIVCHSYPDLNTLTYATNNALYCALKFKFLSTQPSYKSVSRNNYSSNAYGSFNGTSVVDFIYFDSITGKMMRWNPSTNSTPVEFNGTLL